MRYSRRKAVRDIRTINYGAAMGNAFEFEMAKRTTTGLRKAKKRDD